MKSSDLLYVDNAVKPCYIIRVRFLVIIDCAAIFDGRMHLARWYVCVCEDLLGFTSLTIWFVYIVNIKILNIDELYQLLYV